MSDVEQPRREIDPEEPSDEALAPAPEFGEHDEAAQREEWEEDAREGGE